MDAGLDLPADLGGEDQKSAERDVELVFGIPELASVERDQFHVAAKEQTSERCRPAQDGQVELESALSRCLAAVHGLEKVLDGPLALRAFVVDVLEACYGRVCQCLVKWLERLAAFLAEKGEGAELKWAVSGE